MDYLTLPALAAAAIAIASAMFGAGMARVIWADDLRHAMEIDEIRSQTEGYLQSQIKSLEETVEVQKKTIKLYNH